MTWSVYWMKRIFAYEPINDILLVPHVRTLDTEGEALEFMATEKRADVHGKTSEWRIEDNEAKHDSRRTD